MGPLELTMLSGIHAANCGGNVMENVRSEASVTANLSNPVHRLARDHACGWSVKKYGGTSDGGDRTLTEILGVYTLYIT